MNSVSKSKAIRIISNETLESSDPTDEVVCNSQNNEHIDDTVSLQNDLDDLLDDSGKTPQSEVVETSPESGLLEGGGGGNDTHQQLPLQKEVVKKGDSSSVTSLLKSVLFCN